MILGLSGYAQSGKDTVGAYLVQEHGWKRVAFADALKAVLYDLDPLLTLNGTHHASVRLQNYVQYQDWEWTKANTDARDLLQRLGIAARTYIGPDVWVDAVWNTIALWPVGTNVVITDVRFPNEAKRIWREHGQVWRIERPGTKPANAHESETALDHYHFDARFSNDGSLHQLRATVEHLLKDKIALPEVR